MSEMTYEQLMERKIQIQVEIRKLNHELREIQKAESDEVEKRMEPYLAEKLAKAKAIEAAEAAEAKKLVEAEPRPK